MIDVYRKYNFEYNDKNFMNNFKNTIVGAYIIYNGI